MKMKRKIAFRKEKRPNRIGMLLVSIAVVMLLLAVGFKSVTLRARQLEYLEEEKRLEAQIEEEKQRADQLKELETYTKTKKYAEEVAKDKLGLVYGDEIIFKYEN